MKFILLNAALFILFWRVADIPGWLALLLLPVMLLFIRDQLNVVAQNVKKLLDQEGEDDV